MKSVLFFIGVAFSAAAFADQYVQGYMRSDGAYVQPHYQTEANRNPYDNYSTRGNANPYTQQPGTRDPYRVEQQYAPPRQQNFGEPHQRQYRQSGAW